MFTMSKTCLLLLSLLFVFSLVNSETPCPYPCYPPPIGGGGSTQPGGYYPQPTGYYPPPVSGNVPNYPSPPYYGGGNSGGGGYYGPPPPEPILPYFPYYFRKPPHSIDQSSSSSVAAKSTVRIVTVANLLAVVLVFLLGNVSFTS